MPPGSRSAINGLFFRKCIGINKKPFFTIKDYFRLSRNFKLQETSLLAIVLQKKQF